MNTKEIKVQRNIIIGRYLSGRVGSDIFVTDTLGLSDYFSVISSKMIICRKWLSVSHIAIICRTLGITVVQISDTDVRFQDGLYVTYDIIRKTIYISDNKIEINKYNRQSINNYSDQSLLYSVKYQLGIINSIPHIRSITDSISGNVEQLFLRSELLWLPLRDNPYAYLGRNGTRATSKTLFNQLQPICNILEKKHLILHFRGLDLRSDEDFNMGHSLKSEPNPVLGLHGLRQLLQHKDYLLAELGAIKELYASGFHNIIYSLPFVTSSNEVADFVQFSKQHGCMPNVFGVYIETPASVIDIERILDCGASNIYVGTKDLAMLTLAVDRNNESVAHLMDIMSIPVVSQIRHVIQSCDKRHLSSYVFSSMEDIPSLVEMIPSLLGFSVPAAEYLAVLDTLEYE